MKKKNLPKLSKKISKEISELITIMLVNLSDEYPEISKKLTKIVNVHKINIKEDIFKKLHKTYPEIYHNFDRFELCYPQPKIFLDIHQ